MKKNIVLPAIICLLSVACNKNEVIEEGDGTFVGMEVTVLEYTPAPGQFINEGFDATTLQEANEWAQSRLDAGQFVSLGAFGGYLIVQLPERLTNNEGYDFGISGNPIPTHNEPGIVWVSRDENGDGTPGQWYELKGSETGRRNYTVTYYKTDTPGDVNWTDSDGETDLVAYVPASHTQNYYPIWCDGDGRFTLTGTLLPDNFTETGDVLSNNAFAWGYVDNLGSDAYYNKNDRYLYNRFDISNAVDNNGLAVTLDGIDFIKVQSAVQFNMGATGEISTEVTGFWKPE